MNDEIKKEEQPEVPPRDIVGWREDGLIAYIFNVDRPDQFVRLYTPDQAERISFALSDCARQLRKRLTGSPQPRS